MMNARKLGFWCAAYGIDAPTTDKITADSYVAMELVQEPVDALGLMQAVRTAVTRLGCAEALENLNSPMGKIQFMNLVDQA
jgi:hypothetical protein